MNFRASIPLAAILLLPAAAGAAPCVKGTLQDYIALGDRGCTVNNAHFANFTFVPAASVYHPRQVEVQPFPSVVLSGALRFTAPWSAHPGQTVLGRIGHTVTIRALVPSGSAFIGLQMGPERVPGANGAVRVDTVTRLAYASVFHQRVDGVSRIQRSTQRFFAPAYLLRDVEYRISLQGGDGGASLTYFAASYGSNVAY